MSLKHVVPILFVAVLFAVYGVMVAEGCDKCPTRCNGTNVSCPGCDELGGSTCSDVTAKTYSTSVVRDCQHEENSGLTCVKQDEVICYTTLDCVEGNWISFTMCSTGTACVGTFPVPMMCQTCTSTNRTDELVWDWTCESK